MCCSAFPSSPCLHTPRARLRRPRAAVGHADLRLAVVSPFVDRSHGTERALAELLERLARRYHCEIHLYSQHVEDLAVEAPGASRTDNPGAIFWHRVPSTSGPHLLRFLSWLAANSFQRWFHRRVRPRVVHPVIAPAINNLCDGVVLVQ